MIKHSFEVTKANGQKVIVSAVSEEAVKREVKDTVDIRLDYLKPNKTFGDDESTRKES